MRVDGPGRTNAPQTTKKTGKSKGSGAARFEPTLDETADTAATEAKAPASAAAPVAATGSLLALQEAPDPAEEGRAKGMMRARSLLDQLEEVRRGLLLGAIPQNRLEALARMARQNREAFTDPRLNALLDEIELRAEVELAKLEQI
ncbi:class II flagellar assembly regulator [Rhodothalassium salexigens DSM 2132]|uniref:Class II flagellar assembly regulator n=1 Tax=Rhodothalassium salexigens DSM 2132 TaxID=1188247 RepID=A0A4R2PRW5_RHOSA|nr:flagellar assembly protein FliX [Rhodothalassium salexigens]MBB4210425.1 hypothetical protein [Rhodothalassium salexigens DSM 2132]MBK1640067.1 hypothetical protein [Rhodothalassium salexigens DSM 2132]TCP38589.1 class II flagellar assembly regulator [Rhodothalassium salexigens DSM 2132]